MNDATIWTFLSSLIVSGGGIAVVFMQNRKQHLDNKRVAHELERKIDPVSNGFAGHVMESLARIEVRLDEHITSHPTTLSRRRLG